MLDDRSRKISWHKEKTHSFHVSTTCPAGGHRETSGYAIWSPASTFIPKLWCPPTLLPCQLGILFHTYIFGVMFITLLKLQSPLYTKNPPRNSSLLVLFIFQRLLNYSFSIKNRERKKLNYPFSWSHISTQVLNSLEQLDALGLQTKGNHYQLLCYRTTPSSCPLPPLWEIHTKGHGFVHLSLQPFCTPQRTDLGMN
jgi:hypothetical protein